MIIICIMPERVAASTWGRSLIDTLPGPLPAERIRDLNRPTSDVHTSRTYEWAGRTFHAPPGVFLPGQTSRMIFDRIGDGSIPVAGRRYVAMGAGLGVEAVAAGHAGAREIYAVDVHPGSVAATDEQFQRHVGTPPTTTFVPVLADVFDGFPTGTQIDVITFNPPAVHVPVSTDPDVVRNVCEGAPLLQRFFAQLSMWELLAPGGEVFLVASTTADLRTIVGHGLDHGFIPEVRAVHDWQDGVVTHLFRFVREDTA